MSGRPHTLQLPPPDRLRPGVFLKTLFLSVAVIGGLLSLLGAWVDHIQFAYSWFFAFYFFFTLAMGSFFWVTLHYACDSAWSVVIRRSWENVLPLFPLLLVIFAPLFIFPDLRDTLWQWFQPIHRQDHEWLMRSGYDNAGFFYIRLAIYFAFFILVGRHYWKNSVRQDIDGNPAHTRQLNKHSYLALVIFGVFETFLSFDWFMGLDWRWASSLFGVYNFAVCAQAGMAAGIVLVAMLRSGGHLKMLTPEHYHLMGKLLFGFTIFWAYIAFGQFLLIWYANIPDETIFYNDHNRGLWKYLTYFIIVGKFMFPTIYLLAQDSKKSLGALTRIAVWILFMHGVELYWFVMPYAHERSILPSWQDFVAWFTVGSILGYAYLRYAASASLFPTRDPRLVECLTITN